MLERKIEDSLTLWKDSIGHKPLVNYNIGREGHLLTLPSYMQFLLNLQPEEIVLEPMDIDEINRMASEFLGQ